MKYNKKLIEVALPLDAINKACAREKSIRHGHPSTLHLWWARRPLAAARAVIFAQMVDDPSEYLGVLRGDPKLRRKAESVLRARLKVWEEARSLAARAKGTGLSVPEPGMEPSLDDVLADQERQRLFRLIEDLVLWENTTNETVLQAARDEIWQSWRRACAENVDDLRAKELFNRNKLPPFHDPFAGGGALPLEAQRLGLESYASDLNPVAVLINKAMIEIPQRFPGRPPVNPESSREKLLIGQEWTGSHGLGEDVRYYGKWIRDEAEKRVGALYPSVTVTAKMGGVRPDLKPYVGQSLTVVAWLWARTVKSPNPAFAQIDVPLVSSFLLSPMAGKEAYVEPVIETGSYRFVVRAGKPADVEAVKAGTKLAGANFTCVVSGSPISGDYIKAEGKAGRIGARLMAIVAEGTRGRVYLSPTPEHEAAARIATPTWRPDGPIAARMTGGNCTPYGLTSWGDIFTNRQLVALTTFSDLIQEVRGVVQRDSVASGLLNDGIALCNGGSGATAYADAVAVYLSFLISKLADKGSTLCTWDSGPSSNRTASGRSARVATVRVTFGRQALPMTWDFAEVNFFSESVGSVETVVKTLSTTLDYFSPGRQPGSAHQADAQLQSFSDGAVVSTDPPYYDNIGYADLSDFFYVWLRRSLRTVFPDIFATLAVPKAAELVATKYRHGSKEEAEAFFLDGMTKAMHRLADLSHPAFPVTIYYAFKQAESDGADGTTNTGWQTFLAAVIEAGFSISGTWPMRTELGNRMIGSGANALASSIVLVCRKRPLHALPATRREFVSALVAELPAALAQLQRGNIAPVDLAQAAIGPGMAVYTRYSKVLDAKGKPLTVRDALALINQTLDEALAEQEGDFDAESRWALTWFEQQGFSEGEYGIAEQLSKAKNTSVAGMVEAGIVASKAGRVRLLKPDELPDDWEPATDTRLTAWEMVHQLIRVLEANGEAAAAILLGKLGTKAEVARELAYRLYTMCERKKRATEALAYNGLVQSWPEIARIAQESALSTGRAQPVEPDLFGNSDT